MKNSISKIASLLGVEAREEKKEDMLRTNQIPKD